MILGHYTAYDLAVLRQQAQRDRDREQARLIDEELARRAAKSARPAPLERLKVTIPDELRR